jgi:membrane protein DedA with SNARE-associated domain
MPDITGPLVNFATDQIGSYGALAVFILMVLESACIPVPSEAIMLYGGFLVSQGKASLWAIVLAGVAGNVVGSEIAYWVGRLKGREWVLRWRWLHVTPKRLDAADRWFARWGDWAVLVSRMPPLRFTLLTTIGCIPWVLALTLLGRAVGDNWDEVQKQLHYVDYALVAAIVLGIVWLILRRRTARARMEPGA